MLVCVCVGVCFVLLFVCVCVCVCSRVCVCVCGPGVAPESCVIHISSVGRDFRIGLEAVVWTLNVSTYSVTPPYQNINIKHPARVQSVPAAARCPWLPGAGNS